MVLTRPSPFGLPDDASDLTRAGIIIGLTLGFARLFACFMPVRDPVMGCIGKLLRPRNAVPFQGVDAVLVMDLEARAQNNGQAGVSEGTPLLANQ